jgi:hypothetical protein
MAMEDQVTELVVCLEVVWIPSHDFPIGALGFRDAPAERCCYGTDQPAISIAQTVGQPKRSIGSFARSGPKVGPHNRSRHTIVSQSEGGVDPDCALE